MPPDIPESVDFPGQSPLNLRKAILTNHATKQLKARGLDEATLRTMLATPEQITLVRPGRVVVQGMIGDNRLLRVFVDVDRHPPEIVTAYQTSKLTKYRSEP